MLTAAMPSRSARRGESQVRGFFRPGSAAPSPVAAPAPARENPVWGFCRMGMGPPVAVTVPVPVLRVGQADRGEEAVVFAVDPGGEVEGVCARAPGPVAEGHPPDA